jgi:membrane protein YdbS with pleckstrin-like domain
MEELVKKGVEYKKLELAAKKCMRISAIIVFAVILIPASIICLWPLDLDLIGKICLAIAWVLSIAYIVVAPHVRYERYRYAIDEEAIRVRKGFLWITEETVPMERLHKIRTSQGPIARMFKLSTINVTTAGGDVDIQFLKDEEATEIAELLKKKINEIAIKEREK